MNYRYALLEDLSAEITRPSDDRPAATAVTMKRYRPDGVNNLSHQIGLLRNKLP